MQVIPSIDLQAGRSRLVFWPGAASGVGTPSDRPERIARHFVGLGAPLLHLVDLDGARSGRPVNLEAIHAVATAVAVPLQVAGGLDGPEQIELCFAAGATRAVVPLWAVAESPATLQACLAVAGDWLAVGIDARPERLRDYPWRSSAPATLDALVGRLASEGVRRFILSHGGAAPDVQRLSELTHRVDADFLLAGGLTDPAELSRVRSTGISGIILGEALFTGAIDYQAALAAG